MAHSLRHYEFQEHTDKDRGVFLMEVDVEMECEDLIRANVWRSGRETLVGVLPRVHEGPRLGNTRITAGTMCGGTELQPGP